MLRRIQKKISGIIWRRHQGTLICGTTAKKLQSAAYKLIFCGCGVIYIDEDRQVATYTFLNFDPKKISNKKLFLKKIRNYLTLIIRSFNKFCFPRIRGMLRKISKICKHS